MNRTQLLANAIQKVKNNGGTNPIKTKGGDLLSLIEDIINSLVLIDEFNSFFAGELAGKKRIDVSNVLNLIATDGKILPNLLRDVGGGGGNSFAPQTYSFTNETSINIPHNLNRKPIVEIVSDTGESVLFDKKLITTTDIVLNFNFNISGTITYF
jgi:hypothetical protein